MENEFLIFKLIDKKIEHCFENKVHFVDDKILVNELKKPIIKNRNSSIIIASLENISITDLVQVKINVSNVGYFLVNFPKEKFDEESRKTFIEDVSKLKTSEELTLELQEEKITKLISIICKYNPLFVTFLNNGDVEIKSLTDLSIKLNFPLLVLNEKIKTISLNFNFLKKLFKKKKDETNQKQHNEIKKLPPLILFNSDYLFVLIFSFLGTFGITTATFEIMNKESIAIFLSILAVAFVFVLTICMQATIYKNGKERHPYLRYYLMIFIILGIIFGVLIGYIISKNILKTENNDFKYKSMLIVASLLSTVLMLSTVFTSIIANIIILKIKKNKKPN